MDCVYVFKTFARQEINGIWTKSGFVRVSLKQPMKDPVIYRKLETWTNQNGCGLYYLNEIAFSQKKKYALLSNQNPTELQGPDMFHVVDATTTKVLCVIWYPIVLNQDSSDNRIAITREDTFETTLLPTSTDPEQFKQKLKEILNINNVKIDIHHKFWIQVNAKCKMNVKMIDLK